MHGRAHVFDAVFPSICIPPHGSHAALKSMADGAILNNQVFPFSRRKKLFPLGLGNVAPTHRSRLQREVEGGILICRQVHAGAGIRAEADGPDRQPVVPGWQFFDAIMSLASESTLTVILVLAFWASTNAP